MVWEGDRGNPVPYPILYRTRDQEICQPEGHEGKPEIGTGSFRVEIAAMATSRRLDSFIVILTSLSFGSSMFNVF